MRFGDWGGAWVTGMAQRVSTGGDALYDRERFVWTGMGPELRLDYMFDVDDKIGRKIGRIRGGSGGRYGRTVSPLSLSDVAFGGDGRRTATGIGSMQRQYARC